MVSEQKLCHCGAFNTRHVHLPMLQKGVYRVILLPDCADEALAQRVFDADSKSRIEVHQYDPNQVNITT
jgi:hypothetical protein